MHSGRPILFVTHEFPPRRGGIATYIAETAQALAATEQRKVTVWHGGPQAAGDCGNWRFHTEHIPNNGCLNWNSLWQTARFVKRRRVEFLDATVCFAEPGPLFTWLYAPLLGLPWPQHLVMILHGSEILRLAARLHRRSGFRRLLAKAAVIGVVSEYTRGLLNHHFPGHDERVVLVPGALRTDFMPPAARRRPAADPHDLRLLTVARMHPRKGFHHVIEAIGNLPGTLRQRLTYTIIAPPGDERYRQQLLTRSQELGLRLICKIDDSQLKQDYAEADIFAMTSDVLPHSVESFGLVYLEAGASGLPVVAHDSGGVAEAVWHDETGILVKPGDRAALAAALARLLTDPALRRRLGEAGRSRAALLSWSTNANKLFNCPSR